MNVQYQRQINRFSVIHNKHVISGRTVVLSDFEHLNLAAILSTSSLEHLVKIKKPLYPELVHYFYSNLSFQNDHIRSRVLGKDVNISLERFVHLLHISYEGLDIYNVDLHEFEYPEGESVFTASLLLHDDDNPALVRNEEVKYYTLTAHVLAKIAFYNLQLTSGEYSHAISLFIILKMSKDPDLKRI